METTPLDGYPRGSKYGIGDIPRINASRTSARVQDKLLV